MCQPALQARIASQLTGHQSEGAMPQDLVVMAQAGWECSDKHVRKDVLEHVASQGPTISHIFKLIVIRLALNLDCVAYRLADFQHAQQTVYTIAFVC